MPGISKEEFLKQIGAALGNHQNRTKPDYPPLNLAVEDLRQRLIDIDSKANARRDELLDQLADMAGKQGWVTYNATSSDDAASYVIDTARKAAAKVIVRSDHEVFQRVVLDSPVHQEGIDLQIAAHHSGVSREVLREMMASADIGVTGVDYAIAETGTVVLVSRQGVSRVVSLLPRIHIALVEPGQVYESFDDLWAFRRMTFLENGDMGSYLSLISGPSRTADIEQQLVVGVHGPVEVHMVLLRGSYGTDTSTE